ncbi:hypothetical protein LS684_01790 [Cytobacillus spongiae]|uniref:hypothetical protein n=1 Tax=Cytobacillus spongiae TaxID=2901381 RepID=UPI001F2A4EF8|nr:hypothetical protein [Cytobacillus spongiae]UII56245.1 hypothetical protein LS684_01790 [Cytobacillus spongiae]
MRIARQAAFLKAYIHSLGNLARAANEVGVSRRAHYYWKEKDKEYAARFRAISLYMKTRGSNVIQIFDEHINKINEIPRLNKKG